MDEIDYYPAGMSIHDPHIEPEVVHECENCGADITRNERYFIIAESKYCSRCVTVDMERTEEQCQVCGDKLCDESPIYYEVDGERFCRECVSEETAGEEI